MGLLFFISGYFAHGSLVKRGAGSFMRERFVRLGVPTLGYMLVIHPFILLGLNPWHATFPPVLPFYADYLTQGKFLGSSGPLWFTFALLIFCLWFAGWRGLRPVTAEGTLPVAAAPTGRALWIFAASVGVATFLVRFVQPVGTSVLNMQLCFFPQYIAAFALGVQAARGGWLIALAGSPQARGAGRLAMGVGPIALLGLILTGARSGPDVFNGGWHWQAFGYAMWEQLTGTGIALGLLAFFSRRLDRETAGLRWLADRSFAVYVLHAPVIIALFMLYRALPQNPYVLAALLTASGLILTFALADLVRRIPGVRAIL